MDGSDQSEIAASWVWEKAVVSEPVLRVVADPGNRHPLVVHTVAAGDWKPSVGAAQRRYRHGHSDA